MTTETIDFKISDHPDLKNRIVITIDNTGIRMDNPKHVEHIAAVAQIAAKMLYAYAHGIDPDKIQTKLNQ